MTARVPNAALRAAALASPDNWTVMALRAGYLAAGRADTTRIQRELGVKPDVTIQGPRRYVRVREAVSYDAAERLCHAVGCDPVDVGL